MLTIEKECSIRMGRQQWLLVGIAVVQWLYVEREEKISVVGVETSNVWLHTVKTHRKKNGEEIWRNP